MNTGCQTANPHRRVLTLSNTQRDRRINTRVLRRIVQFHLEDQLRLFQYDLSIHLLSTRRMAGANETHLQHAGPTDVITFDYRDPGRDALWGELLICPAVAVEQARDYGTSWESELLRYILHGILHLRGFDDRTAADRRVMKREEDRLLRVLVKTHPPRLLRAGSHDPRGRAALPVLRGGSPLEGGRAAGAAPLRRVTSGRSPPRVSGS